MKKIKENKIQCKYCKDIIISENRHDFKWCECKKGSCLWWKRLDDYIDLSTYEK